MRRVFSKKFDVVMFFDSRTAFNVCWIGWGFLPAGLVKKFGIVTFARRRLEKDCWVWLKISVLVLLLIRFTSSFYVW